MFASLSESLFPISQIVKTLGYAQPTAEPLINIQKSDGAYIIDVVAPGFAKEAYSIHIDGQKLRVSASRAQDESLPEPAGADTPSQPVLARRTYIRRDFLQANFEKNFNLPDTIDTDAISASYADGILSIRLPLREELRVQRAVAID